MCREGLAHPLKMPVSAAIGLVCLPVAFPLFVHVIIGF